MGHFAPTNRSLSSMTLAHALGVAVGESARSGRTDPPEPTAIRGHPSTTLSLEFGWDCIPSDFMAFLPLQ